MRAGRRLWLVLLGLALLSAYPLATLGYVYGHTMFSDLPGGRHGPRDAYRHALAAGFVAYTISPRAVKLVSRVMESDSHISSVMDRHNNAVGAAIGTRADSLADMQREVLARVNQGGVMTMSPDRLTWMPPRTWRNLPF
jgi:hypothetical protein